MITDNRDNPIRLAWQAGAATAEAYKPGDLFLGAIPECEKQGFGSDPVTRSVFIHAYVHALKARGAVRSDRNNIIVSIG